MPVRKKLEFEDLWGPHETPAPTFEKPQHAAPHSIPLPTVNGPRSLEAVEAALGHWGDDVTMPAAHGATENHDAVRLARVNATVFDGGGGGGAPAQEDDPAKREAALIEKALTEGPNADRAKAAYDQINALRAAHPEAAERLTPEAVAMLLNGVADPRSDSTRGQAGVLGVDQVTAAAEALMAMPEETYHQFSETLDHAGQNKDGQPAEGADAGTEQALLLKALAARRNAMQAGGEGATKAAAELVSFGDTIRGEKRDSLIASTTLIDIQDDGTTIDNDDSLKQTYTRSCAPSVALMALGEMDPIFARNVHDKKVDPAALQLDYMNHDYERAVRRDGTGSDNTSGNTDGTFVRDAYRYLGATDAANMYDSDRTRGAKNLVNGDTEAMNRALKNGQPVPLQTNAFGGHFMLATDVRIEGTTTKYLVSDPWTGKTAWVTADDLTAGNFSNVFGDTKVDGSFEGAFVEPT